MDIVEMVMREGIVFMLPVGKIATRATAVLIMIVVLV
jgi:hypothetical protein